MRPVAALPDSFAVSVLTPPPVGIPEISTTIFPAHLIPAGIRKDILDDKDVNRAFLCIAVHDVAENKSYAWGDVSVVFKSKNHRLNRKLSIMEFVLAFGMFRDVVC